MKKRTIKTSTASSRVKAKGVRKATATRARKSKHPPTPRSGPTDLLNKVSFVLNISTTNTAPQRGMLLNRFEQPDSKIKAIRASPPTLYADNESHELSQADLRQPAFHGSVLTLYSNWRDHRGATVDTTCRSFRSTKGYFTVAEVVANIVAFEKIDRPKSLWFGGIDCHHVFFEGLHAAELPGTYGVSWGS